MLLLPDNFLILNFHAMQKNNRCEPLEFDVTIEKKPSAGTHGGNASEIKIVGTVKADILAPVLQQIEIIAGKEVIKYCQKTLVDCIMKLNS